MATLDLIIYTTLIVLGISFVYIVWSYIKGLKASPRELYILFIAKVLEYSAYGAMNLSFVLFLTADAGLGDIAAGTYIGIWSVILTVMTMLIGAVCDAIGIKRTLLVGTVLLIFARFFMPLSSNILLVSVLGFIPMALGMAMMGPVLSVGIKKYTTKDTAALGFGLFYTLMNVGWAAGAWIFDKVRGTMGEHAFVKMPVIDFEFSTYQVIFAIGFALTVPTLFMILSMREGVVMVPGEDRYIIEPPKAKIEGNPLEVFKKIAGDAVKETVRIFREVVTEKAFWIFLFMLGILIFVRLTFYHFHYTWPKYGIRVLGEGLKIGSIYGVLNPVMIVFLTPLIAALFMKVSSYRMLVFGTAVSASSVFIAVFPPEWFAGLMDTWVGELIFVRWLEVPEAQRHPLFFALILFVIIFTIGEAFWSPRLMQFTAEIAPPGKEGSYIALSYLPFFAAKLFVGPLSGWLVAEYTPEGAASYPNHYMVWVWIGGMAIISPIGLVVFRKLFLAAESKHKETSQAAS